MKGYILEERQYVCVCVWVGVGGLFSLPNCNNLWFVPAELILFIMEMGLIWLTWLTYSIWFSYFHNLSTNTWEMDKLQWSILFCLNVYDDTMFYASHIIGLY